MDAVEGPVPLPRTALTFHQFDSRLVPEPPASLSVSRTTALPFFADSSQSARRLGTRFCALTLLREHELGRVPERAGGALLDAIKASSSRPIAPSRL